MPAVGYSIRIVLALSLIISILVSNCMASFAAVQIIWLCGGIYS